MNELPGQIPLDALTAFVEVAKTRSFTGASCALFVTPSAVSHRIADLERQLGVQLFVRTTRSVRLTEAGRVLFGGVEGGLEQIHESVAKVRGGGKARSLTVSCSPSFAILRLLPQLSHFKEENAGLEVHVAADDRMADPRREDIDVCIRYGAGSYPGLTVQRLATEWVFPVCSPDYRKRHRLRRANQLGQAELIHHDVLREHPGRVDWTRWLKHAGLDPRFGQRGSHFSHAHMALSAALAGQGVALGRTSLVADALRAGHLVAPWGPRMRSGLAYHFVTVGAPSNDVQLFHRWLRGLLRRRLPRPGD